MFINARPLERKSALRAGVLALAIIGAPIDAVAEPAFGPFFKEFCIRCHGNDLQTAEINFAKLTAEEPLVRNKQVWLRVIDQLADGKMPPRSLPQPSQEQRQSIVQSLDQAINHFDYSKVDNPGALPLRRLTHIEYSNTIRDIFSVDLKPAERFTSELTGESGFDNSANTLFLDPGLMERYIEAAERIVDLALPNEPATPAHRRTRDLIFVAHPNGNVDEANAAQQILKRFSLRAFRRPPSQTELNRALQQYQNGRRSGLGFEKAIKRVLAATLISPKFLFRIEAGGNTDKPHRVGDWELASRLSYFMWASMPDDELFDLASRNELHKPEVLLRQVRRMLLDARADSLGTVFAAQWLGFTHIGTRVRLGPLAYPWCTDSLMDSMKSESAMFFLSLLRDNQPIAGLINANYTYVNEELATTLYGFKGIQGDQLRRVTVNDPNRAGILGHASVLAVTSNYNQTSPVKRGHYILDTVLGTPPPPPPPNAGVFKEDVLRQDDLTFREKLAMHSNDKSCHGCHSKIDPLGFSLENFDFFGRWRDKYEFNIKATNPAPANVANQGHTSRPQKILKDIDTFGTLPDGYSFNGPAGLKRVILERRHDDLVRQTVSKMLAYALGRQLEYYDEPAVLRIIDALKRDEYRFQTLLNSVVLSYPFQYRRNAPKESSDE